MCVCTIVYLPRIHNTQLSGDTWRSRSSAFSVDTWGREKTHPIVAHNVCGVHFKDIVNELAKKSLQLWSLCELWSNKQKFLEISTERRVYSCGQYLSCGQRTISMLLLQTASDIMTVGQLTSNIT